MPADTFTPFNFVDESDPLGPPANPATDTPLSAANLEAMQQEIADQVVDDLAVPQSKDQAGALEDEPRETVWSFQPVDTDLRGPFMTAIGGGEFNGYFHPVQYDGYNYLPTGLPDKVGEGRAARVLEAGYNEATYGSVFEMYSEFANDDNDVTVRPHFIQFDKSASTGDAALTEHYLVGSPLQFKAPGEDPSEHIMLAEIGLTTGEPNLFRMYPHNDRGTTLRLSAGTGQTAIFAMGYNGTDNIFMVYPQSATYVTQFVGGVGVLNLFKEPNGAAGTGAISVGSVDGAAVGTFDMGSNNVAVKGVVVRGASGQLGNLLEIQDNSSALLSGFTEGGWFFTRKSAAPADAELSAGEMAIWFDKTNSAAKLMIKAKENGGTVRTGSVSLA